MSGISLFTIRNKSQNYKNTFIEGGKTQFKSQVKFHNPKSSEKENLFARYLQFEISKHFDETTYHAVPGLKNVGILSGMEIDIPIIVFNHKQNFLHLFAVKYHGHRHTRLSDNEKKCRAKEAGWEYIAIKDQATYSNDIKALEDRVRNFCIDLVARVNSRENSETPRVQVLTGNSKK